MQTLEWLTTAYFVGIISHMNAKQLVKNRTALTSDSFAEVVVWRVPQPLVGSAHSFKYSLAYVVAGVCVLRYDNEAGKGDHRHFDDAESAYSFSTPDKLMADFFNDISRWNHEHHHN